MLSQEILKGTIRPLIIKLILENEKMYGYQITQKVKGLSSHQEGALYPALHKLEREGILDSKIEWIGNREKRSSRKT